MRFVLMVVLLSLICGCSDDPANPEDLVTVSGIVRSIDDGSNAEGVRVWQLGTEYKDVVATGTDGAYSIQVPRGSALYLYTDDFDSAQDSWFPLINIDVVPVVANGDISGLSIHSCPQTECGVTLGSVGTWDNYLTNGVDRARFNATSSAESGGIVSLVFLLCDSLQGADPTGLSVSSGSAAFPNGYAACDKVGGGPPDCQFGPDIMYPDSRTIVDEWGWYLTFGDSTSTEETLMLTIADTDSTRNLGFTSPFPVPVRPGTISLILANAVDGNGDVSFDEVGTCLGWLSSPQREGPIW